MVSFERGQAIEEIRRFRSAAASPAALTSVQAESTPAPGVDSLGRKIASLKRREHSLKKALGAGKTEAEMLRARLIARGRAYYRIARGAPQGDFLEHAVRVERLRQGLLADMHRLAALKKRPSGRSRRTAGGDRFL